jgi:hypothetical protein
VKIPGEALSGLTNAEVAVLQGENRARKKDLRQRMADLVNRRLAQQISYEEYTATRRVARDEVTECEEESSALRLEQSRRAR